MGRQPLLRAAGGRRWGMASLRLFLAIPVPPDVQAALAALMTELRRSLGREGGLKWVAPENLHLTLRFFGELPEAAVAEIHSRLGAAMAGFIPFPVVCRGLGGFPPERPPRVIWVGMESEGDRLPQLQQRVVEATADLGQPERTESWTPHVTLARVRPGSRVRGPDWALALERHRAVKFGSWTVFGVHLISSELRSEGATYRIKCQVDLTSK